MTEETAFNHGSVVSLKLKDFMQFRYVECHPGPSLNVIIGPNGSGKSSIVNGEKCEVWNLNLRILRNLRHLCI